MAYSIEIEGCEGQNIEVKPPGFLSGAKLLVNGKPAPKGPRRGQMLLKKNDGTEMVTAWQASALGFDIPKLVVDGQVIEFVTPLKWSELLWSSLPILLVFIGGALGAIAGAIAFNVNTKIFRADLNEIAKYALTALVSIATVVIYVVLAILVVSSTG